MGPTVRDLIRTSLRMIGVLASGENPSAEEQNDAFWALNNMVAQWSIQKLFIYSITEEIFQFNVNQQIYTMGPGGDFNTTRPNKFYRMNVRINANTSSQLDIPMHIMNTAEWAAIGVKLTVSSWPTHVYPDFQNPLVVLNFWPIPQQTQAIEMFSWKSLAAFTSPTQVIALPPGYMEALESNLAVRLAPEYGKAVPQVIADLATTTKMNIKIENHKINRLKCDQALRSKGAAFNWYTGEPM
jgi:hypothetical protein